MGTQLLIYSASNLTRPQRESGTPIVWNTDGLLAFVYCSRVSERVAVRDPYKVSTTFFATFPNQSPVIYYIYIFVFQWLQCTVNHSYKQLKLPLGWFSRWLTAGCPPASPMLGCYRSTYLNPANYQDRLHEINLNSLWMNTCTPFHVLCEFFFFF